MKPLLVTSGEPAGIGLDICLSLSHSDYSLVVIADKLALLQRAAMLGLHVTLRDYVPGENSGPRRGELTVLDQSCAHTVMPGVLNSANAPYVMSMLDTAVRRCLQHEFSALVTAPVHKEVLNQAGISFSGHTEFFAARCGVKRVVMMLACEQMKVALVTTHIPLRRVAKQVTKKRLTETICILHGALCDDFGILSPNIAVAGLNPHAGEGGYLGREEIDIIIPVLHQLQAKGMRVHGPYSADTLFLQQEELQCDVFLAMYHDQGLPVLKQVGFGEAVNITLGLPIISTSVDHGTALSLAGTGRAQATSLLAAVEAAARMVKQRELRHGTH
jgi:4-hydroxythreonine-4-phosphate dehydrogenase